MLDNLIMSHQADYLYSALIPAVENNQEHLVAMKLGKTFQRDSYAVLMILLVSICNNTSTKNFQDIIWVPKTHFLKIKFEISH